MNIETPDWVRDAIFYQIFPDRFAKSIRFGKDYPMKPKNLQAWGATPTHHGFQGGDLLGVIEKLDYLQELGINAIYFNPIFASASNHRYHTHDYYVVDPILGGNRAFKEMLDAAHARNIRVILDGVFNHASRGFFQFNHLMECGHESPYVGWFHVHDWPINAFQHNQSPNYDAWWGLHSLPKFNTDNKAVREFLLDVGEFWLKQGIDGWRLDVPNEIDDDAFWQEFRRRCKAINPDAYIVGELWHEAHRWLQGDQFDGQMNYMFTRAVMGYFSGHRMEQSDTVKSGLGFIHALNATHFAETLDHIFNKIYDPAIVFCLMNMLSSHDVPRMLSVADLDKTAVRLMFMCQMTVPGAPNIYYGDEIGLAGQHDPDCRRAFPWQDKSSWDQDLLAYVRQLIQLRKEHVVLRRGNFRILYANEHVMMYQRELDNETAVIAFNSAEHDEKIIAPPSISKRLSEKLMLTGQDFIAGEAYTINGRTGRIWIS